MKQIAVLLTCYNRKEKTLACLSSLHNCLLPLDHNLDIFLVDDGSNDGTSEAVASEYPNAYIIKGTGSLFWNRGMHLAWITAINKKDFDFYLWLNDDTTLSRNAIEELLACEKLKNGKAIVCGAVNSSITGKFTYGGRSKNGQEIIPNGLIQNCNTINGNCVLINRFICSKIGVLDPTFPHAIGDYEYGLRAIKNGFDVITTRNFIGQCERNVLLPKWCYGSVSLKERWKSLYSPLGNSHPKYFFIFEIKHYGIIQAVKHYITIHLRVLIPSLWN